MPWAEAPGSREHDPLVAHPSAGDAQRAPEPGQHHARGALDVVVERAQVIPEAGELEERVLLEEVLPLQDDLREDLLDRGHEGVDELLVRRAAHALVAHPQVQRVGQALLVVGTHVEGDGQGAVGRDPRAEGVEAELADGDAHAARPLVAQAQDALAVRHHDDRGVLDARAPQDRLDLVALLVGDVEPAAAAVDVRELLAGLAHHRRVDDRHHLVDVLEDEPVEEGLVPVVERGQVDELLEVAALGLEALVGALHLLLDRAHRRGHEAVEVQLVPLPLGEGRALVRERVEQQRPALLGDRHVALTVGRIDLDIEVHDDAPRSTRGHAASSDNLLQAAGPSQWIVWPTGTGRLCAGRFADPARVTGQTGGEDSRKPSPSTTTYRPTSKKMRGYSSSIETTPSTQARLRQGTRTYSPASALTARRIVRFRRPGSHLAGKAG